MKINRRHLFKSLLGLPLLALAAPASAWMPKPKKNPKQDILLSHGPVVNGNHVTYQITYFWVYGDCEVREVFTCHGQNGQSWNVTSSPVEHSQQP